MMTAALEVAQVLGASPENPDDALTWEARSRIARDFNVALIQHLGRRTLFTLKLPGPLAFVRKKVPWSWLLKPMLWAFDAAVETMPPQTEAEVTPDAA